MDVNNSTQKTSSRQAHPADTQSIFHPSVTTKMWIDSISLAFALFCLFMIYLFVQDSSFAMLHIVQATAATAAIMIGSSFALSGFCFYFDFLDTKIGYRKYLGLTGYFLALTYSFLLLLVDSERYFYGFFSNVFSADFILGLTAMGILTVMAIISNKKIMIAMGVKKWRYALRLGYVAILLLIIRAFVLEYDLWVGWLQSPNTLPPVRLTISLFAGFVLLLRLSMMVVNWFQRNAVNNDSHDSVSP